MSELVIERPLISEWEAAMEVAWKTFLKFEASEYGKEGTDNFLNFISDEKLFKMFLAGEYHVITAKLDGEIVGVASVRSKNHISLLFVDEKYHKRGYGRMLLKRIQEQVYELTDSYVMTVNAAPYGVDFYKKVGFIETDAFKQADGITYLPMQILTKI